MTSSPAKLRPDEAVYSVCTHARGKSSARLSRVSLCIGSLTRIPPNTQLHPIAPTLAAPRAPTHPIGASSLWKAWNSQPVTPEAASIAAWGREPRWPQHQCQD